MKKEEFIEKYGEAAYERKLKRDKEWRREHISTKEEFVERCGEEAWENVLKRNKAWAEANPEKIKEYKIERSRKDGRFYAQTRQYNETGLQGKRKKIRQKHSRLYAPFKKIIDPKGLTQIHHEWIPGTADYRGVALVEADQHRHGFIDVIQVFNGEIALFTEAEIKGEINNGF